MATFDEIKVGDQVIINAGGYKNRRRLATVERVTATQFVAGGCRFTKRGWEVGGNTYHSASANAATPELVKQVEAEQRYRKALQQLQGRIGTIGDLWREIDRSYDSCKWAATLEAAALHLEAAVEQLKVRQTEIC